MLQHFERRNLRVDDIAEPPIPSRLDVDASNLTDLCASMAKLGLLEPVGVKHIPPGDNYLLCFGHRRLRAARKLGWYTIPAVILPDELSEAEARQAENNQRVQLTPVEEARELRSYVEAGQSVEEIAFRVNHSETWVRLRLRLLTYPPDLLDAIHHKHLTLGIADQLAKVEHEAYRKRLTDEAVSFGATAQTVMVWVQHYHTDRARIEANTDTVEQIIQRRDDYRVTCPCEYCGARVDMSQTRIWRLCTGCSNGLAGARDPNVLDASSHANGETR